MESLINDTRRIRGTWSKILFWGFLLFLFFLGYPSATFAGGCEISEGSLSFDRDPQKRLFSPNTEIVFEFQYRVWAYSGKPYDYCVFELRKFSSVGEASQPQYFVMPIHGLYGRGTTRFHLPEPNSKYILSYHEVPFFSFEALKSNIHGGFIVSSGEKRAIEQFYKNNYAGTKHLTIIQSTSDALGDTQTKIMTIYFKQGLKARIDEAVAARQPPTFEWYKGEDSAKGVYGEEYSYRLRPHEDWKEYSTTKKCTYYFLTPGQYAFEVRARYTIDGQRKETAVASLPFEVAKVISVTPPVESLPKGDAISPQVLERYRYQKSTALLIGVSEFNDPTYKALPYVKNDLHLMSNVLQKHGFTIELLDKDTSKKGIEEKLNKVLNDATKDDRVIVYISAHGTSQGLLNFIVPTDANSKMKGSTCISYEWLKKWTDDLMIKKGVKHLLIILDACQAGLGLYSKSDTYTPLEVLLKYPSAHMMTAGLMEQNAQVDTQTGVSVFTQILYEGLEGKAELTDDNIITLSELLVYVQRNVSKYVKEKWNVEQVPSMGIIRGPGEMLFFVKRSSGDSDQ